MRSGLAVTVALVGLAGALGAARADTKGPAKPKRAPANQAAATAVSSGELEIITNSVGMKLVRIPGGSFEMGSQDGFDDEVPVHRVTLTRPFYLGATEVTQAQYEVVMGENPSQNVGPEDLPVETVNWDNAVRFCEKLSELEGVRYRLPTEAEWEYACRAGGHGPFGVGPDGVAVTDETVEEYAWLRLNSGESTHPVGQKKPNAWGLYDMHGNVFEWCQDNWLPYPARPVIDPVATSNRLQKAKGDFFVLRGGSWEWGVDNAKAAARCRCKRALRSRTVGLRAARSID